MKLFLLLIQLTIKLAVQTKGYWFLLKKHKPFDMSNYFKGCSAEKGTSLSPVKRNLK